MCPARARAKRGARWVASSPRQTARPRSARRSKREWCSSRFLTAAGLSPSEPWRSTFRTPRSSTSGRARPAASEPKLRLSFRLLEGRREGIRLEPTALASQVKLIGCHIGISIHPTAGPSDFDQVSLFQIRHTHMHSQVAPREIAVTADHLKDSSLPSGRHRTAGTDTASVALHPFSAYRQPVPGIADVVTQQGRDSILVDHQNVDGPVIVDICECRPPAGPAGQSAQARGLGDVHELVAFEIAHQVVRLRKGNGRVVPIHLLVGMAVGNPEIQPPIVVEVEELCAPAAVSISRWESQSELRGPIHEEMGALVFVERVVLLDPLRDEYIEQAVVVVVSHSHAHGPFGAAVPVHSQSRFPACISERAVTVVDVIEVRSGVVDHVNVRAAVVIEVTENDPETMPGILANNTGRLAYVCKRAITVVVVEEALLAFEIVWRTCNGNPFQLARVGIGRARRRIPGIELGKIGHVQVKVAVIIVIAERCTHTPLGEGPVRVGDAGSLAHVRKSPIAVVAIKLVWAEARDVNVGIAVVIVVTHCTAAMPAAGAQVRFSRHVRERAIAVVPQQVVVRMLAAGLGLSRGTVNQIDVLIAVVVIVEETSALAVHFGQVLAFLVATDNLVGQPNLSGDVREKRLGRLSANSSVAGRLRQAYTPGGRKYQQPQSNPPQRCQLPRLVLPQNDTSQLG